MPVVTLKTSNESSHCILLYLSEVLYPEESDYYCSKVVHELEYNKEIINLHLTAAKKGSYTVNHTVGTQEVSLEIIISDLIVNDKVVMINLEKKPFEIVRVINIIDKKSKDNTFILDFIEKCEKFKKNKIDDLISAGHNKIHVKSFNGYCWDTISIIPKRSKETLFLKEGQIDSICNIIDEFISKDTYNDYIKNGISYKCNIMLYGCPGVGKTSLIHFIASEYNIDISTININSELKESQFVDAFRTIAKNTKSGLSMIVIEDFDCIFTNRKDSDSLRNNLTLHGILNTLDGFSSKEGLIVIITTNKYDVLDEALVRSRRIDHKIELSYIDKYQANNMFSHFFKDNGNFDVLWEKIKSFNIQPSSLHQFLFENRKNAHISPETIKAFAKEQKSKSDGSMYT
jgi:ATP-dependent 26S proteasome regulatory subunit